MIFAIDPGFKESAYVISNTNLKPKEFGKINNFELLQMISTTVFTNSDIFAVEMVSSYGLPVGQEVFDTCFWIGRFWEACRIDNIRHRFFRKKDICINLCGTVRAKDKDIINALYERFAYGENNYGKGNKKSPGHFYGFKDDIWQAYAVAVTANDMIKRDP